MTQTYPLLMIPLFNTALHWMPSHRLDVRKSIAPQFRSCQNFLGISCEIDFDRKHQKNLLKLDHVGFEKPDFLAL